LRLGLEQRIVVDLLDRTEQTERFELEDACGFDGLVARQRQEALDARLSQAHQRADDGVGVHVLAGDVRNDVQSVEQTLALKGSDHGRRLDVRNAAGALGQGDRGQIESRRDRRRVLFMCLEELLDRIEAEPRSARQFRQNDEA